MSKLRAWLRKCLMGMYGFLRGFLIINDLAFLFYASELLFWFHIGLAYDELGYMTERTGRLSLQAGLGINLYIDDGFLYS